MQKQLNNLYKLTFNTRVIAVFSSVIVFISISIFIYWSTVPNSITYVANRTSSFQNYEQTLKYKVSTSTPAQVQARINELRTTFFPSLGDWTISAEVNDTGRTNGTYSISEQRIAYIAKQTYDVREDDYLIHELDHVYFNETCKNNPDGQNHKAIFDLIILQDKAMKYDALMMQKSLIGIASSTEPKTSQSLGSAKAKGTIATVNNTI